MNSRFVWMYAVIELLGSVELDLDWRVSPAAMRDRRVSVLQVAGAPAAVQRNPRSPAAR